jgi:hypothetical protein
MRAREPAAPFRWDLARREQLGTLVARTPSPQPLWFGAELATCAARVVARSADGDLVFVGRSAESVFDYLSGVLSQTSWRTRLRLLAFSMRFANPLELSTAAVAQLRANLQSLDIAPARFARRGRPVVLVDLVSTGATFGNLVALLRRWAEEDAVPWERVRRNLRLIGITRRTHTSPNTWRWHQHADWVELLPRRAIINVSVTRDLWTYFGDMQTKLTSSFGYWRWARPERLGPRHDPKTLSALAEAVAIFDRGSAQTSRLAFARLLALQPTFAERWLSRLALELKKRAGKGRAAG